jgi:hypothetical protein
MYNFDKDSLVWSGKSKQYLFRTNNTRSLKLLEKYSRRDEGRPREKLGDQQPRRRSKAGMAYASLLITINANHQMTPTEMTLKVDSAP